MARLKAEKQFKNSIVNAYNAVFLFYEDLNG